MDFMFKMIKLWRSNQHWGCWIPLCSAPEDYR